MSAGCAMALGRLLVSLPLASPKGFPLPCPFVFLTQVSLSLLGGERLVLSFLGFHQSLFYEDLLAIDDIQATFHVLYAAAGEVIHLLRGDGIARLDVLDGIAGSLVGA